VPKQFPPELKIRAVALLLELKNAERAAAQVMREFPGFSVTGQSVARWGKGLRVKLRKGRRQGAPGSRKQTSPHRARVLELLAQGTTQSDVARMLGISRQLVHALSRPIS
jgi:transposase-like protein